MFQTKNVNFGIEHLNTLSIVFVNLSLKNMKLAKKNNKMTKAELDNELATAEIAEMESKADIIAQLEILKEYTDKIISNAIKYIK